jgi:hypothetical protein
MWVILRLLTAFVVGGIKFFHRRTTVQHTRRSGGIDWVFQQQQGRRRVASTSFGVSFVHPVFLRLSQEGGLDRFFKAVGFAREFQANDPTFDRQVYVACDHPAIEPVLQEDATARAAILALFAGGAKRIYTDGAYLWVQRSGDTLPSGAEVAELNKLRDAFAVVPADSFRMLRDSFFWRALAVESIAWSIAFYGAPAIIETITQPEPLYFNWGPVIRLGLLTALALFTALGTLAWLLLRGSSRAHRVFTESIVVLAIGVPLSAIAMVSDANIALDRSEAVVVRAAVEDKYTTTSHRRRGRRSTRYHVLIRPPSDAPVSIPRHLKVSASTYAKTDPRGHVAITLHPGRFNLPWVEIIAPAR